MASEEGTPEQCRQLNFAPNNIVLALFTYRQQILEGLIPNRHAQAGFDSLRTLREIDISLESLTEISKTVDTVLDLSQYNTPNFGQIPLYGT